MKKEKKDKQSGNTLIMVLSSIFVFFTSACIWLFVTFQHVTIDQLLYQITSPMKGTSILSVVSGALGMGLPTAIWAVLGTRWLNKKPQARKKIRTFLLVFSAAAIAIAGTYTWNRLDAEEYAFKQKRHDSFVETNYVDPSRVQIRFPEKKRNLVYIFLESMEMTYSDEADGGAFETDVIPELTRIAQENECFAGNSGKLNGGYAMPGATWTSGAMFGQTSGMPLLVTLDKGNLVKNETSFFPTLTTMGDILKKEGYNQELLIGSDATFGGRKTYFTEHGDFTIRDYNYAKENGWIPEDYYVWWGYEDAKLFSFAKEEITNLAKKDEPFNFTMLTVDTHFEDGYVCPDCPETYDTQYANVMACSSKRVAEFVSWLQQQDFYENTTVVIFGDHPTMDRDFCNDVPDDYVRRVYTAYINAPVQPVENKEREYTTFDNFPTVLAALGADIEGERLGLGTNLFSDQPTLREQIGIEAEKNAILESAEYVQSLR